MPWVNGHWIPSFFGEMPPEVSETPINETPDGGMNSTVVINKLIDIESDLESLVEPFNKKQKQNPESSEPPKFVCVSCKKRLRKDQKMWVYRRGEQNKENEHQRICEKCLKNFVPCQVCQHYFKSEELKLQHCPNCIFDAPRRLMCNYTFKVEDQFEMLRGEMDTPENDKEGKPKDQVFYGIELELASKDFGLDVLIVSGLTKEFALLKKDSSIKPQGFEVVSRPATLDAHYHLWDEFFEKLPPTCLPLRSCGMHVHASRNRMSDLQIGKMLVFLHAKENRPFVELIAGRSSNFQNDFEKPKTFTDGKKQPPNDHHTALNLLKENTIEFRIFASTCDKRVFLKNIEFCKGLIKWADWSANSIREATNYRKFVDWIAEHRKDYEYLSLFLETPSAKELLK